MKNQAKPDCAFVFGQGGPVRRSIELIYKVFMIGKTILHYRILEKLGEGGMGVVYKAEDTKLKREVAIKFLPHHISVNQEERQRFEIEAQAAASLNHPNISTIHSIEESGSEVFIVQEYIEGKELKDLIKASLPSIDEALNIAMQIAEGLKAAHTKGIIHRDIKSSNIMISKNGNAKIMDFGLAKIGQGIGVTKINSAFGTAAYMSPEQIQGSEADHRTDIWSFGVVMYEMLTGQLPFKGDYNQAYFYSILNEDPRPITGIRNDIPDEYQRIIFKALSKNPADRYGSINELISELKKIGRQEESPKVKFKTKRLKRKPYLLIGSIFLSIIILFSLLWNSFRKNTAEADKPAVKKLAIVPFINIRNDTETNFLGFALADQIIGSLAYVSNILVRPSSAVRQYENQNIDPASVGNKLKVDFILTGSYLKEAGIIRLNLELIDIHNNELIWRHDFDVKYENTFKLQEIVSEKVT
ncbi:MAG: protein kinase domain-containing protein, partial [Ignavibacteria bacterium]